MKESQRVKNQIQNQRIFSGLEASIEAGTDRPFDFQVGGNTFNWKEELKQLGFVWEPYRCWHRTFSGIKELAEVLPSIKEMINASKDSLVIGIAKPGSTKE